MTVELDANLIQKNESERDFVDRLTFTFLTNMFFHLANLLTICIFAKKIAVADSYYGHLTDLGKSTSQQNLSHYEFSNCSIYNIAYGSSCTCFDCSEGRCTICCNSPGFKCCYCHACLTSCWKNDWQLISVAQVGMSTALLIATVATIALFFRICNGGLQMARRGGNSNALTRNTPSRVSVSSVQQYIIERLQDRPPQYNDLSDAPPVYDTDPANRVATAEPPPKYTRKPQDTESTNEPQLLSESSSQSTVPPVLPVPPVPSAPLHTAANHM